MQRSSAKPKARLMATSWSDVTRMGLSGENKVYGVGLFDHESREWMRKGVRDGAENAEIVKAEKLKQEKGAGGRCDGQTVGLPCRSFTSITSTRFVLRSSLNRARCFFNCRLNAGFFGLTFAPTASLLSR